MGPQPELPSVSDQPMSDDDEDDDGYNGQPQYHQLPQQAQHHNPNSNQHHNPNRDQNQDRSGGPGPNGGNNGNGSRTPNQG